MEMEATEHLYDGDDEVLFNKDPEPVSHKNKEKSRCLLTSACCLVRGGEMRDAGSAVHRFNESRDSIVASPRNETPALLPNYSLNQVFCTWH